MSRYNLGIITPTYQQVNDLFDNTQMKGLGNIKGSFDVFYGYDHACGYFLQLFPEGKEAEDWLRATESDCWNVDSLFDGLTGADLGYFLNMFHASEEHINGAFLDLSF